MTRILVYSHDTYGLGNLDLDDNTNDDLTRVAQKIELEAFYEISPRLYTFAELKLKAQQDTTDDRENKRESGIERGETWVYYLLPNDSMAIQIGRQSFRDKREWWWDNDLDALRLHLENGPVHAELAVAEEITGTTFGDSLDAEDKDISRLLGNVSWRWAERQQLDLFWFRQNDDSGVLEPGTLISPISEDDFDTDANWIGVRAQGRIKIKPLGRFYYWADIARVDGDERVVDYDDTVDGLLVVDNFEELAVSGTAFDVGVTWRTELSGELSVTLGYAEGSADNEIDDGRDDSFHQTGLQDNNAKFRGVDRFRYYGELFRPEMSNLRIATLSIGRQLLSDSSIEIVFHHYQQVRAQNSIRDSRLKIEPNGLNTDLGNEIDFVVGLEEWKHWEIEVVASVFYSGKAFGDRANELSYLANAKVNYNF